MDLDVESIDKIRHYTNLARGIAWDECHKIYILLDDEQMKLMKEYEYDPLISKDEMSAYEMTNKVIEWFDDSCGLRFIHAVETNHENPNKGFLPVVPQGYGDW